MAIIAAAVCSRSGQIIFSRVYCQIAFGRLESLISAFPRLVETGQQHTFIEKDCIRYLFQPVEENYVVVLTNRSSNLIADLKAVSQFAGITTSTLRSKDTDQYSEDVCFNLLIAFDEVYSELGIAISNQDVLRDVLAMESNEEAIQEAILQTKTKDAKEAAKQKIKQLEMAKKEALRAGRRGSDSASPIESWSASVVPSVNIQEEAKSSEQRPAISTKLRAMKLR